MKTITELSMITLVNDLEQATNKIEQSPVNDMRLVEKLRVVIKSLRETFKLEPNVCGK
jgi:hypothetical protein